ncbi:MAG: stage III sporulation protein AA [Moorellales bacterium]
MAAIGVWERFQREILPWLAPSVREPLRRLAPELVSELEEVRLRAQKPLVVVTAAAIRFVTPEGHPTDEVRRAYTVTGEDLRRTLEAVTRSSWYALTEQLREGYLTLPGGHRLGLAGEAVPGEARVAGLRHVASLNLRLAREVPGCSLGILPYLWDRAGGLPWHTLVLSPPRAGKTTFLRDVVRHFSYGVPQFGIPPSSVGLVDERGEIAACFEGVPQNDVGPCTDVLSGWPKAQGMLVLLRALSPRVIATDEMGGPEDLAALYEVLNAGVKVVATVHASDLEELRRRPAWRRILGRGGFERLVVLSRRLGPGTVEAVLDGSGQLLFRGPWRAVGIWSAAAKRRA